MKVLTMMEVMMVMTMEVESKRFALEHLMELTMEVDC